MKSHQIATLLHLAAFMVPLLCMVSPLNALDLTYPDNGETLRTGEYHQITWTDSSSDNVKIELTKNGQTISNGIIARSVSNTGSYRWKVPADLSRKQFKIKISYVSRPKIYDYSNYEVNFVEPFLEITHPQEGEVLLAGSEYTVRWNSSSYEGYVFINFSSVPVGVYANSIISWHEPNSGSYIWKVPDIVGDKSRVDGCRISINFNIYQMNTGTELAYSGYFTIARSLNPGSSSQTQSSNSSVSSNFPQLLVAEWYDDASGGWNVSIRDNNGLTLRTGNVFYNIKQTFKEGDAYRVLTQRQGTNEYHTFFFKNLSNSRMSINHTQGNVTAPVGGFSGHHTK